MIKRFLNKIFLYFAFAFKKTEEDILSTYDSVSDGTSITQEKDTKSIFQKLLKGEITEEVKQFRYKYYRILEQVGGKGNLEDRFVEEEEPLKLDFPDLHRQIGRDKPFFEILNPNIEDDFRIEEYIKSIVFLNKTNEVEIILHPFLKGYVDESQPNFYETLANIYNSHNQNMLPYFNNLCLTGFELSYYFDLKQYEMKVSEMSYKSSKLEKNKLHIVFNAKYDVYSEEYLSDKYHNDTASQQYNENAKKEGVIYEFNC